jgi:hypothetical protein
LAEELTLTTPVVKTATKFRIISILMRTEVPPVIPGAGTPPKTGQMTIELVDDNDKPYTHQYYGDEALNYIKYINTANFTTKSMHRRLLEKLSTDGVLPGTVSGTPEAPGPATASVEPPTAPPLPPPNPTRKTKA